MARRGRPPKRKAVDDDGVQSPDASDLATTLLGESLPPPMLHGVPNPEYFRRRMVIIDKWRDAVMTEKGEVPKNLQTLLNTEEKLAERHGFDPKHLLDVRTPEEKWLDGTKRIEASVESILEFGDAELAEMEAGVRRCINQGAEYLAGEAEKSLKETLGKVLSVFERVRRLRTQIREERPFGAWSPEVVVGQDADELTDLAVRATHVCRQILYCDRQTVFSTTGRLFDFAMPHIKMACDLYMARHSLGIVAEDTDDGRTRYRVIKAESRHRVEGLLLLVPPRHGKTAMVRGVVRKMLIDDPNQTGAWLHASESMARMEVNQIRASFTLDDDVGRRCRAIYPHAKLHPGRSLESGQFTLMRSVSNKNPTLRAAGVKARGLGADYTFLIEDDILTADDGLSEATRTETETKVAQTWGTRLTGDGHFRIRSGYPFHTDDVIMKTWRRAAKAEMSKWNVSMQRVGGTYPNFVPVWQRIGVGRLRSIYNEQGPARFGSNYQMDPSVEGSKIVSRLRYYDPESEEHRQFCRTIVGELSIDPAATANDKSDNAGIVYFGIGEAVGTDPQGGATHETQARILDAREIKSTIVGLINDMPEIVGRYQRVDRIHYERVGFSNTFGELFENLFGHITPVSHTTGGRSKEHRLKQAAPLLEHHTGSPAKVLFPGKANPEYVSPEFTPEKPPVIADTETWGWLYEQVLNFGTVSRDHSLDAITQFVLDAEISRQLSPASGAVSMAVSRFSRDPNRMKAFARDLIRRQTEPGTYTAEHEFLLTNWN